MRYGGNYEPYHSGGLYGTPQVVYLPAYGFGFGSQGFGNEPPMAFGPGY
jgi:hypothetical protein